MLTADFPKRQGRWLQASYTAASRWPSSFLEGVPRPRFRCGTSVALGSLESAGSVSPCESKSALRVFWSPQFVRALWVFVKCFPRAVGTSLPVSARLFWGTQRSPRLLTYLCWASALCRAQVRTTGTQGMCTNQTQSLPASIHILAETTDKIRKLSSV